jgi:tetratricopeptide (TPR) repeat protein
VTGPGADDDTALPATAAAETPNDNTSSATPPALEAGALLAERYRVVRFIARGGMGEVYEAEDLELHTPVALKTLRRELARDDVALERFRREILLSRRVTHPNVCRVFDVFRHQGPRGPIVFLTMELLEGETLAQRVRRLGHIPPRDCAAIVRQLCEALAAAHAVEVVHRDFKTANVILVSSPGEERAVVTDFGLARALDLPPGDDSRQGKRVGTSAYMAPEQVEGRAVSVATDVYALGIVLFEMVTGRVPFLGTSPLSTAMKRLREPPPAPRSLVPDLDPRWEAAILKCLAREPADRFPDAPSVWAALAPPVDPRRLGWMVAAAAAVAVVLAAAAIVRRPAPPAPAPEAERPVVAPVSTGARRSVAVLGLKNLGQRADVAWLSAALAEMLSTELAAGGRLRIIPGENVSRMRMELALPEEERLARDTLERIRLNLGSDVVVLGSYMAVGPRLRLDVRVQDTRVGETLATVTESGTEGELLELVSRVGARLRDELGAPALSEAQAGGLRATLPGSTEAARLYTAGLDRLRSLDAKAALGLLEQAAEADPEHPLVHAALADTWAALGYDKRAEQTALRALDLAARLPPSEKLLVQARYQEHTGDYAEAVETYRTLVRASPDNLDLGLRLAGAFTTAGRPAEALTTLSALRAVPTAGAPTDPRIDLEEAAAANAQTDYRRVQAAAARAAAAGDRLGARLLVARSRAWEAWAYWNLGDPDGARQAYEEARAVSAKAGDPVGEARALRGLGTVLAARGELSDSLKLFRQALGISRKTGRRGGEAAALNNIASVLYKQGDLRAARESFEEAIALQREIGGSGNLATSLANVANIMHDLGDIESARRMHEEALSLKRGLGEKLGVALGLNSLGDVRLAEGDLDGAERLFRDSRTLSEEVGSRRTVASSLHGLGEVQFARGDLPAARRLLEESLAIRDELGERGHGATGRLSLAVVDLEEGHVAEAEQGALRAATEFAAEGRLVEQALAQSMVARARVGQKRPTEAREAADAAVALVTRTEHISARILVALAAARVRSAQGRPAEAVRLIESALADAQARRLVPLELEARLALAELEAQAGRREKANDLAESLKRDAEAAGYGLLARRAAALVKTAPRG